MIPNPAQFAAWAGRLLDHPLPVAVGVLSTAVAALALVAYRSRRAGRQRMAVDRLMTFTGAVVATAVVGTGMWQFFGDVLHINNKAARVALFAFFEIAMLASALRSRRFRLDTARQQTQDDSRRKVDVDGIAVWVLALLSGLFAATDQDSAAGAGLRIVAPLIAAWLWERGLAGELRQFTRQRSKRLHLRISVERVLVFLRIAEPAGRDIADVDRGRQLAKLATARYRLNSLPEKSRLRRPIVSWLYMRRVAALNERLGLADDLELTREFQMNLAALYRAVESTTPEALAGLDPWSAALTQRPTAHALSREATPRPVDPSPRVSAPRSIGRGHVRPAKVNGRPVRLVHGPTAVNDAAFLRGLYGDDQSAEKFPGRNELYRIHGGNLGRWSAALKAHADRADQTTGHRRDSDTDSADDKERELVGVSA